MKHPLLTLGASGALLLACFGCGTDAIATRIQEKSTVFTALPPAQQKDIREGTIQPGYTADMVYMALGKPSQVKIKDTAQGKVGIWIYHNFYPEGYEPAPPTAESSGQASPPAAQSNQPAGSTGSDQPIGERNPVPASGAVASDEPAPKGPGAIKEMPIFSTTDVSRPDSKLRIANPNTFSARSAAMDPLSVPDMPSASLYVIFFEGRVVQMKLGHE